MPLIDHVNFSESVANWETVAKDFVLRIGSKKRVELFIKQVNAAKIEVERQMRRELDVKIVQMKPDKLIPSIGKDIMDKVRFYSRKYRLHLNVQTNEIQSMPVAQSDVFIAPEVILEEASPMPKRPSASPQRQNSTGSNGTAEVRVEDDLVTPTEQKPKFSSPVQ